MIFSAGKSSRGAAWCGVAAAAVMLAGCMITPTLVTPDEVRNRVQEDSAKMYAGQAPISGPVTLEEAIARALKYNLDYRLKKMESALALGITEYTSMDLLPSLLANAGYRTRNNAIAPDGNMNLLTGVENVLPPLSTEERRRTTYGAEFSWNVLDFGVSYYRARQSANQFLVAEERRRKVVQGLVQDVRASYWRALGAQRLAGEVWQVTEATGLAIARSREAERQKLISPILALNYQRALLDVTTLLNLRRQDLEVAKAELAALMNVAPGVDFTLAEASETKLPDAPRDLRKLEEAALLQRPELREEDLRKRISADEARKQIVGILPGISFDLGAQYDSNRYLYNNSWSQAGIRLSWNLMRLFALPSLGKTQEAQVKTDEARRMALAMAILTQLRVGAERYRLALEDFKVADEGARVDARIVDFTRASVSVRLENELESIRVRARAMLGNYQRMSAYAYAQIAFGRLNNTLGFDPLPDDFEGNDLAALTARIRAHLNAVEKDAFKMTSNLFGNMPAVSIRLAGVSDPVMQVRMTAQVSELLTRNQITAHATDGLPMTFTFKAESSEGVEKVNWLIEMADRSGATVGQANYVTTLPELSRNSTYEAALIAAVNSNVAQMRGWLSKIPLAD